MSGSKKTSTCDPPPPYPQTPQRRPPNRPPSPAPSYHTIDIHNTEAKTQPVRPSYNVFAQTMYGGSSSTRLDNTPGSNFFQRARYLHKQKTQAKAREEAATTYTYNQFIIAIQQGRTEWMEQAIRNAPEGMRTIIGCRAVNAGALSHREDILQLILGLGVDINWMECGRSPLATAAVNGDEIAMQVIIRHGGDVRAKGVTGMTAFLHAAAMGYILIMERLLEWGADLRDTNHLGQTALHLAALNGKTGAVQVLLKHGLDANSMDYEGHIPLDLAILNEQQGTDKLLSEHMYLPLCRR